MPKAGLPENIPLESVLDSVAEGIFTVDLDWNITFFNQAAGHISGIPPKDAVGQKCWEVFASNVCDGDCPMRPCLESGKAVVGKSGFILRADGEKIPIGMSSSPLKDKDGTIVGGVESFRDLSSIQQLMQKVEERYSVEDIRTNNPHMIRTLQILPPIAQSTSTVLVLGESGTGKELFARAIHNLSLRKDEPFVAVNCGALPGNLLESELFGYKAGAFTDARKDKPGRLELAQGGTLFLDEIGDMPLPLQVKLLRVLQEKVYEPLGGVTPLKADVRFVAATNRDLEQMVAQGEFRQDLYFRLNVVRMDIPPLRDRTEDIPLLTNHFIRQQNSLRGKSIRAVSENVHQILFNHDFPGNVRELENVIEYAFILCPGEMIETAHLPEHLKPVSERGPGGCTPSFINAKPGMAGHKYQAVLQALEKHKGNKSAAARELGVSRDTVRRILARGAAK
ncbi:sigma-54 interaction domain-containing protein [Pseudodesulfovibrio piezophilus]|uniref:PAS modulated sigma54 specific transcriptional regulator, Fis family n=1 Tax=Pseudodesulfovibrio piezophilus (strain DSM 21447 / JCM 15486 / C1TLV30) TaxID=1322246 RepID=M1WR95_PSEP2|nr:sigma-54-dependent Fis family transcriptional regulator [Pseudodesulfovibrio piezophilus]CCH48187.1 PAS modulated sigma54 specific transcriptional regulator, Fis family [Pseudodesulfovibrio piezophilus C1TLV30]